eukprot:scaffold7237_cov137-Isochrysis_galbana.AAC.3
MPTLPQNDQAGGRTPWTLHDEANWRFTDRFSAWSIFLYCAICVIVGVIVQEGKGEQAEVAAQRAAWGYGRWKLQGKAKVATAPVRLRVTSRPCHTLARQPLRIGCG